MIIVSNTSPINNLAAIGYLHLLEQLYNTVYIPEGVYQELMAVETPVTVSTLVKSTQWIKVENITNPVQVTLLQQQLHRGEAEAIALAIQLNAELLLIDEKRGRMVADNLNLKITGVLGILIKAKNQGLIPAIKPLLKQLKNKAGFWIKPELYINILERIKE